MPSYILRNIDPELWRRFKSEAALEGLSIKALLEQFIQGWLKTRKKGGRPKINRCELCGEPAGEGNAICPACQASR